MPSRVHANSAPNDRERVILNHVVTAQRELEKALGLIAMAKKTESKSGQRKVAYGRMGRDVLEAANRLSRIRGTHSIQDDREIEPYKRPERELLPPPPVASPIQSESESIGES